MKRNLRQVAAVVCCAVTGYLTIATTCLHEQETRGVSTEVELQAGVTAKRFRLNVGGAGVASLRTDPPLTFRVEPANILPEPVTPQATTAPAASTQPDAGAALDASASRDASISPAASTAPAESVPPGTPALGGTGVWVPDCSRLDCSDLHFVVERTDATEAVRSTLDVSVTLTSSCDGRMPDSVAIELEEDR